MITTQREQGKGPFTEVTIGANTRFSITNSGMGEAAKKVQLVLLPYPTTH